MCNVYIYLLSFSLFSTGFGVECVCFLVLGFVSSGVPALTFLIIGIGLSGFTVSGWQINHLDLAPRYVEIRMRNNERTIHIHLGHIAPVSLYCNNTLNPDFLFNL